MHSPNTPGLRDWQRKDQLERLLTKLKKVRDDQAVRPPLLLKLAPDLSLEQAEDIAGLILKPRVYTAFIFYSCYYIYYYYM